jgi:uncharacterized protein with HEPN domain
MTKHKDIPYIEHIAEAIRDIESFTKGMSGERFMKDRLRQSAVVRQLERQPRTFPGKQGKGTGI